MTDTITMALIAGLPATLTALTGLIVSIKNGRKTDAVVTKVDDAAVKQQEIHTLVNSNLTKVKDDLAEAKAEITALKALVKTLATNPLRP